MKLKKYLAFLLAVLLLSALAGCGVEEKLDAVEDRVEDRLDTVEDALTPDQSVSAPSAPSADAQNTPVESAAMELTREQAEAIALEYAGFTADQVSYIRTDYEIDDGIPQYDVEFHEGAWEYEFEIHAETGKILSFDKDDR